jgi:polyhydroxyalkanoate synthesis regulator phasin
MADDQMVDLQDELVEMGRMDQEFRARLMPVIANTDYSQPPSPEFLALIEEQNELDSKNSSRLREIVNEFGWPGRSIAGEAGSEAAQLMLQHATLEQQKVMAPSFREAVERGDADAADLAALEDSILVGDGQGQLYGTEIVNGPDGQLQVATIQDPDNLDARRASVGLSPMDEYIERIEAELGVGIGRGNMVPQ